MHGGTSEPTELTELGASEIARRVHDGRVSAREVTEAFIRRIVLVDPALNAVVIRLFDRARVDADSVDERKRRGEPLGLLAGVPVTIKEQFKVKGTDTTFGVRRLVGRPYMEEGPLVTRLRAAGAVILGKTNVSPLLMAWESDNPVYGRANNPWDVARSPGGSSGGEAAILAAHASPLGLGGDLGGSIRVPAHFCGVAGLKPTARRFSNTDTPFEPVGDAAGQEAILPQPGPMARSVEDLRLAMRVFSAPGDDRFPDFIPPLPWSDSGSDAVRGLRIGFFTDNGVIRASPALRRAVEESAKALEGLGALVKPFVPPDGWEAFRLFVGVLTSDGGSAIRSVLGGEFPHPLVRGAYFGSKVPSALRPAVGKALELLGQRGMGLAARWTGGKPTDEFWRLAMDVGNYRKHFVDEMARQGVDALVCPPFATVAPPHGATELGFALASYAFVFNVTAMPAGVVPATRVRPSEESDREPSRDLGERTALRIEAGSAGLPVGVQVAAPPWEEERALTIMAALERHFESQLDYPRAPRLSGGAHSA